MLNVLNRPPHSRMLLSVLALAVAILPGVRAEQNLTDAQVAIVVQRLADGASHSWEFGTREQALIELNTPSFSVLNKSSVPPSSTAPASLSTVLDIIGQVVKNKTSTVGVQKLAGAQPLFIGDGSAADPASNGVAAIIANWTGQGNSSVNFGQAAADQITYLFDSVPKTSDGALSHRVSEVQLWSDFIYMVPPFLAYYGVVTENQTMVSEGYHQISLYRHYLRNSSTSLWKHVVMGSDFTDEGFWSTGNGWAAAGMLHVLATIQNSQYAKALKSEMNDLRNWVNEIHDGMYAHIRDDGMFHNYVDDNSTFVDASGAALLASTVYRHAVLTQTYKHLPAAESVRRALWAPSSGIGNDFVNSSSLVNMTHFTSAGWLTPVVNPDSFGDQGSESPEGQAFVVQMFAAWRDWVDNGAVGANAAVNVGVPSTFILGVLGALVSAITSWAGVSDEDS